MKNLIYLLLKLSCLTSKIKVFILFYTYWTFIYYFFTSDLNILFMLDSNLSYKIIYRWVICGSRWRDFNWSLIKRETEFKERFELVGVAGLGAMRDTWLTNFQEICFQERAVWRHAICNFVVQELGLFKTDFCEVGLEPALKSFKMFSLSAAMFITKLCFKKFPKLFLELFCCRRRCWP